MIGCRGEGVACRVQVLEFRVTGSRVLGCDGLAWGPRTLNSKPARQ